MSFFGKLKARMLKSSSRLEAGVAAIVEGDDATDAPTVAGSGTAPGGGPASTPPAAGPDGDDAPDDKAPGLVGGLMGRRAGAARGLQGAGARARRPGAG